MSSPVPVATPNESLVTTTHIVYALHTVSLVIGALGTSTLLGAFLFGWPSIIAVVVNYVKRSEARGTWLESHFSWQIRTFWYAMLWAVIVFAACIPLGIFSLFAGVVTGGLGFLGLGVVAIVWFFGFFALGIWATYRIARGWLRLKDRQPMPT